MYRFIAYQQVTPQLIRRLKVSAVLFTGFILGTFKASIVNQKYKNVDNTKLTQYQNQDQLNSIIQMQKKPAVIYYYLPMTMQHSMFRQMMFKYSNLYPQNAIWVMVSLPKKLQQAKSSFDLQYPTRVRLQVRYPKSSIAIRVGQQQQFMELKEKGNRRDPYRFNYNEQGFKKFLEQNRIIEGKDPIKSVLSLTNKSLFKHIQKPIEKKSD